MTMTGATPPVRGFFTYPWHLLDEPVETTLARMKNDYYCNAIAVAGSYHTATLLTPRSQQSLISERRGAMVAFNPDLSLYAPEGPWPLVDSSTADEDILGHIARACDRLEMQLNLWLVVLHSSSLGQAHPDLCQVNLAGDRYSYALCPSQSRVRAYAVGLVKDVCQHYRPHTLLLESAHFMPPLHGGHHEISLVNLNPLLHWLMGLCFCPACVARAEREDVDSSGALEDARSLLTTMLDDENHGAPSVVRHEDISGILMEMPRLQAYSDIRVETVMSLLQEIGFAADVYNTRVEVIPNTGVRPLARSWQLGVSIRGLKNVVSGAMVLGYYPDAADVEAELRSYKSLAGALPFSVALNAGYPQTTSPGSLSARAAAAVAGGARGLFYYNWSLLTERRLDWVRQANLALLT